MADVNTNSDWEDAPQGANSLQQKMLANDAQLQTVNPNWPTGGTAAQIKQESNFNPNAVSTAGAVGLAQVMPDTLASVEKQTGRKLDPTNVSDALFIHRYLMEQNLQRFKDVPSALKGYNGGWNTDNWNNPETANYPDQVMRHLNDNKPIPDVQSTPVPPKTDNTGWEDAGWENPQDNGIGANLEGLGLQAANFAAGGVEALPIAGAGVLGMGRRLLSGENVSQALGETVKQAGENYQEFSPENALNKLGVDTTKLHQTLGYDLPQKALDFVFDKVPQYAGPLLAKGIAAQTGYDKPLTKQDSDDMTHLVQGIMLAAPAAGIFHEQGGGAAVPEELATKLAAGNIDQPGMEQAPESTFETEPIPYRQYFQQPELFDNETQGEAPQGPGLGLRPDISSDEEQLSSQTRGGLSNNRQMELQLDQGETLRVSPEGEVFPESVAGLRDQMSQRVTDFNEGVQRGDTFTQGDLFNNLDQRSFDQYGNDENSRPLSQDEFEQTLGNLSTQEGTRFEMPDDPEKAYERYLDTVRDDQGGLFDRPSIAKNFVDMARDEAADRFVSTHPVIQAANKRIANLEQLVASTTDSQVRTWASKDLNDAQATKETAQQNLRKNYTEANRFMNYKDGVITMNMGAPIPDWIKHGLVKMMQGLHGIVFKTLNNLYKGPTKVDSFAKILGRGIKDALNKEATRDWQMHTDEAAVNHLQQRSPLGNFDAIKEWIPDTRTYEDAKPDMIQASDMDSNWLTKNVTAQGGVWASALSKNPIVKWAFTKIQDATKATDFDVKRLLTNKDNGLRSLAQQLNDREKGEIHALMDMNEGKQTFTSNDLKSRGFSDKQVDYYNRHQEVMKEVFDKFNQGLSAAGLQPIDRRTAYMASRFMGDFRSLIYQKGTTRPVGFVGHNFRPALKQIIKYIDEQHPGKYDFEEPTLNRGSEKAGPNMFQGYLNVLNHFELNDPEMKAIMDTYRDYFTQNASKALQALQHAKDKQGIMGAEGRKAWLSQEQNAIEGMKSQLTYSEHMIRWANMQEAASEVKKMMSDEELNNKPNARSYVKDYMANALGQNSTTFSKGLAALMDGVADKTGVGPSLFRKANNAQKSALLQLWLGFARIPHSLLTMTQFFQSNPAFASYIHGKVPDVSFWGSSMKGTSTALNIAKKSLGIPTELTGIDKAIYDYNQKNGVFDVQLKSHLTDINSSKAKRNFDAIAEANITYPEAALRSTTFSIWTHALHEAGMPLQQALGTAENLTRGALVDYRPTERPLVYGKMGFLGDIASTLTRFKMNQISQHQFFAKEAGKGNMLPIGMLLASSVAFAGMSGLLGFNYADELYHGVTYLMGKPDRLKAVMLRNMPDWANYGLMSQLGINMQGSYSNADTIPDNTLATLFPTGNTLADMAKSVGQAAYYHDAASVKKLLYNFSPTSLKGIEENTMFSKNLPNGNKAFFNPNTNELQNIRTPGEQAARDLAFHPFQEARDSDVRRFAKETESDYASLRQKDLTRYTDKIATNTMSPNDIQTLQKDWISHRGDPNELGSALQDFYKNRSLTANQRTAGTNVSSLGDIYRFQDVQKMKGRINQ